MSIIGCLRILQLRQDIIANLLTIAAMLHHIISIHIMNRELQV
jgi:hypothetical protein